MSNSTSSLIVTALAPVLFTYLLGFISGKRGHFHQQQAEIFTKLVMFYTLPLGLFSGILMTPRSLLLGMGVQSLILVPVTALMFFLPFLLLRLVWRKSISESTLQALVMGTPSVLFLGVPILGPLLGPSSTLVIVVSGLVQNLVVLPVCLVLMSVGDQAAHASSGARHYLQKALAQPVVWAPMLGIVLVLTDIQLPHFVSDSCRLLGMATGGLTLFAAGLLLQSRRVIVNVGTLWPVLARNVLTPGACYLVLVASNVDLQVIQPIVMAMALPTGSIALIVALQFKQSEREVASAVALSTIASAFTIGGFAWLTSSGAS